MQTAQQIAAVSAPPIVLNQQGISAVNCNRSGSHPIYRGYSLLRQNYTVHLMMGAREVGRFENIHKAGRMAQMRQWIVTLIERDMSKFSKKRAWSYAKV